jgi:outer membrane protein assembly factor BamB
MGSCASRRFRWKRWLTLFMAPVILLAGSLACGMGGHLPIPPYNSAFGSTGSCQSASEANHATGATLATVISLGPNTTICMLDPNNGLLKQHFDLAVHGDVAGYADGLIYINERGGSDGHTLALCAAGIRDGHQRWCQPRIQVPSTFLSFSPFLSENGVVYVSVRFLPTTVHRATSSPPSAVTPVQKRETAVYALNEADGSILWQRRSADVGYGTLMLVLNHSMLYIGEQNLFSGTNQVCALQTSNGTLAWCFKPAEPILNGLTVAGGLLYVRTSTDDGWLQPGSNVGVYALDAATGSQRWVISLGASATGAYHPVIVASNGAIYVNIRRCRCGAETATPDDADYLFALNASNGSRLWSTVISTGIWTLASTDTVLYVGTQLGGGMTAVRTGNGAILWHQRLPSDIPSDIYNVMDTLVHSGQTIYVSISYDPDSLVSVNTRDGSINWQDEGCHNLLDASPFSPCYWGLGFPEPAITVLLPG